MATNIPPHNLGEVIDACLAIIEDPLVDHRAADGDRPRARLPHRGHHQRPARHPRGLPHRPRRIQLRARTHTETEKRSGREAIIVTELPYQVNKARLLEKMAELVKEKKLEGIAELRDESDKDGMRMVIEIKRDHYPDVVLNNLYQHTQMQTVFGINMVALVDGQPRTLNLKQLLEYFLRHRRDVVTRRTIYELRKARERAHLLEGYTVALANIDEVIALIKASRARPRPARG
jgi:DNA gyrase subunit A